MATLADFETLEHCKLLNISGMGWSAPLIRADFGGGYGAGVIANQDYGLHRWTIRSDFLPDKSTYTAGDDDEPYFTYFFEFFKRHVLRGNKPFIVKDTRKNKYYLVSFDLGEIDFNRITAKFYSFEGIVVNERRHPDLEFNADGSLIGILDDTPPTTPTVFAMAGSLGELDTSWTASTDEDPGVDHYEIELTLES